MKPWRKSHLGLEAEQSACTCCLTFTSKQMKGQSAQNTWLSLGVSQQDKKDPQRLVQGKAGSTQLKYLNTMFSIGTERDVKNR